MLAPRMPSATELDEIAGQLGGVYRQAEYDILGILARGDLTGWNLARLRRQLLQIRGIEDRLGVATEEWANVHIPALYLRGMSVTDWLNAQRGVAPEFSALHERAVEAVVQSCVLHLDSATGGVGRWARDVYRAAQLQSLQVSLATGENIRTTGQRFLADLRQRGVNSFRDAGGRAWRLSEYAEMVALTNSRQATQIGMRNRMTEWGVDLVQISAHGSPCPICAAWEGVVVSLTGATEGYPTLDDAQADGYNHPRCEHTEVPWSPEIADVGLPEEGAPDMEDPDRVARMERNTERLAAAAQREAA